jgi:putative endopeptidase
MKPLLLFAAVAVIGILGPAAGAPQPSALHSGIDLTAIDRSARPQDDLYRFANGRWLDATAIPADRVWYGTFVEMADRADADVREIIERAAIAPDRRSGSPSQQIADLYTSVMDAARLEALGDTPIRAELTRIDAIATPRDLAAEMGRLSAIGTGGAFAGTVGVDARGEPTVQLEQAGTLLPDRDYYLSDDAAHADVRAKYVRYLATIFRLTHRARPDDDARAVVALESKLAEIQVPPADARDPAKTAERFTLDGLSREMRGFDWRAWAAPQGIDRVPSVILLQPSFFKSFAMLAGRTPMDAWRAWLAARYITASAPYLSAAFVDARFAFFGVVLSGQARPFERWKRGVSLVNAYLADAVGRRYVEKRFTPAVRDRATALTSQLIEAYRRAFAESDWMSESARSQASKKLARLKVRIGYPDRWHDYHGLVIKRDDLMGNVQRALRFENSQHLARLDPSDRGEWTIAAQTVNASYSPSLNEIILPAAMLQPPLFDPDVEDAANYGALGAIVAHEIAHGFDDRGRGFDAAGAIADWWTPADERAFEARAQTLVGQFDAYTIPGGARVNGALTRAENAGDLAGLAIAVRAYERSLGGKPSRVIDGFTGEQRLFLAWAQMWRMKTREEYARQEALWNPYAPARCRANGAPANLPAFYDAFDVRPGDRMFRPPAARASIW